MSAALDISHLPPLAANDNGIHPLAGARGAALQSTHCVDCDRSARGNVTRLGGLLFTYDRSDQPVALSGTNADGDAINHSYAYDGNLKRVKSVKDGKTRYHIYDASGRMTFVYNATDNTNMEYRSLAGRAYARFGAEGGGNGYIHADYLGTPRAVSHSGHSYNYAAYTPFGETVGAAMNDNHPGFTGHIKDAATGLNYMQARYYDPAIGRFLSIDPVTFLDTGVTDQFNRYSYTANDPINWTDPNGECPWCIGALIGGAIELGVQLSSAEGRQAYVDAGRALASGDFSGAFDAAGSNLARVGISAGAGAVGAFGATRVAQGASAVARTTNSVRAAEATNVVGNVVGNAVVGAGVGAGQQATRNIALGENGSVGAAAYGGAVGGALGASAGSLMRGNAGNLADATGNIISSPNGTLTAPLVGRGGAPEAIGEIAGAAIATTADMGARCSIDEC